MSDTDTVPVTIYPAYSLPSGSPASILRYSVPRSTRASVIKRLVGHDKTAFLYVRLVRHAFVERCPCLSCAHDKQGWWRWPPWMGVERASVHRWLRIDIGDSNVYFKNHTELRGGEHFVIVAAADMDRFASELCGLGRYGMLAALEFYRLREVRRAEGKPIT